MKHIGPQAQNRFGSYSCMAKSAAVNIRSSFIRYRPDPVEVYARECASLFARIRNPRGMILRVRNHPHVRN